MLVALTGTGVSAPIDIDMRLASTAANGGALRLVYDFSRPVLVNRSFSDSGLTRSTGTQPGFNALDVLRPVAGAFGLKDGTLVNLEILAIDPPVTIKLGAATLDAAGTTALIGAAPDVHVHPEWRLLLPDGAVGSFQVTLRLTTTTRPYQNSSPYTFVLSNDPTVTVVTTTTTTLPLGDVTLAGRRLQLRDDARRPKRRAMTFIAPGPLALPPEADPRSAGGSLRLASTAAGFDAAYGMPAAGWRAVGSPPGSKGYRFVGSGAVRRVVVHPTRGLRVLGAGDALAIDLTTRPDPVNAVLTLGSRRFCAAFGGTTQFTAGKLYRATGAAAPDGCAP